MFLVHVHIKVRPEKVKEFITATEENAKNSILEMGVLRFDFIQDSSDETSFMLIEAYKNPAANAAHKDTRHYRVWRELVNDMMAEPRQSKRYKAIYPAEELWANK